jgi:hypothetical protein
MPKIVTVSALASTVSVSPATIAPDGTDAAVITVRVVNTDGNPMPGLAAANVVLSIPNAPGRTLTQPTGVTNANGEITGSLVGTINQEIVVSATVLSVPITDTAVITIENTDTPWSVVRNFNSGTLGTSVNNQSDGMTTTAAVYDDTYVAEGPLSAKTTITQGAEGFGSFGGIVDFPFNLVQYDELWMHVWLYVPANFDLTTNSGSLKFMRVRSRKADNTSQGYLDWQIKPNGTYRLLKEGQSIWYDADPNAVLPRAQWVQYIWHIIIDDVPGASGGLARVRAWQDGVLIQDENLVRTMNAVGDVQTGLYLFTFWNGGAPQTQSVWLDDIRIANTKPSWAPV